MAVTTLAPAVSNKERKQVTPIVNKVVREAARKYYGLDLLVHVYLAGLWHGAELTRKDTP